MISKETALSYVERLNRGTVGAEERKRMGDELVEFIQALVADFTPEEREQFIIVAERRLLRDVN